MKASVHENVMFPPDAVRPGERADFFWLVRGGVPHATIFLMAGPSKAHAGQEATADRCRCPHALRDEYTRTIAPVRAVAAETLPLERKLKAKG